MSSDSGASRFNGKETHPRFDQSFDARDGRGIHQMIEIFDLPEFDRLGKYSSSFEESLGFGISRILIDIDDAGSRSAGFEVGRPRRLDHLLFD